MSDTQTPPRITPALIGFLLAAALIISLCSVMVSQTESDATVNGKRVVQLGYGLPIAFTSATTSDTNPLNIFTYFDQAANPAHWQALSYLADVLLWLGLLAIIVWQGRVSISLYSLVGLVLTGIVFLLAMNLIFSFA